MASESILEVNDLPKKSKIIGLAKIWAIMPPSGFDSRAISRKKSPGNEDVLMRSRSVLV